MKPDAGRQYCEVKMFYTLIRKKTPAVTECCGLPRVLLVLFFKGTPVLEKFKMCGQYFYFSLKQLVENRNRQAMKA